MATPTDDRGGTAATPLKPGLERRQRRRLDRARGVARVADRDRARGPVLHAADRRRVGLSAGFRAVVGLVLFIVVMSWQIRTVVRSRHPGIRAIEAVALVVPLFLLLFAWTYFLMSTHGSGSFSQEDLTRTDALYFSVTVFSTVGFGDISATSQSARSVVTAQMILNLLLLGVGDQRLRPRGAGGSRATVRDGRGRVSFCRNRGVVSTIMSAKEPTA